jgi:hypothetical protein
MRPVLILALILLISLLIHYFSPQLLFENELMTYFNSTKRKTKSGQLNLTENENMINNPYCKDTSTNIKTNPGNNIFKTDLDTIEYILYDDFESWTSNSVNSIDSLMSRWQINTGSTLPANQSIVNISGHGNVWKSVVLENRWQSLELNVSLGDTASELWFDYDFYADPDFNHIGKGGGHSGKMLFGFCSGNNVTHLDSHDTITKSGRGGWIHEVWGSSTVLMGYRRDHIYNYYACGECGIINIPKGYWTHISSRVKINTIGANDGFYEVYENGILKLKVAGLKFRSLSQGVDFGKIEMLILTYFFGGTTSYIYASPRTQFIYFDNLVVYKYKPGAVNYGIGQRNFGNLCSQLSPPGSSFKPGELLTDELYTNASDTIYDVGNDKSYIYWPPFKKEVITKEIIRPEGNINYTFLTSEFGYPDYGIACEMYVKVYSGTGKSKTLLKAFGRTGKNNGRDPGYEYPSGNYVINTNTATIEIYPGCNGGITRGIAIKYWQSE